MAPILSRVSSDFGFGKRTTAAGPSFSATGGTKIPSATSGNGYTYHVFLYPDNLILTEPRQVEYLVVAGGGAGGGPGGVGGGGGAGGYRTNDPGAPAPIKGSPLTIPSGTYPIAVGTGGPASSSTTIHAPDGNPSIFHTIASQGGGGGGINDTGGGAGNPGGSGGGSGGALGGPAPGGIGNSPSTSPPQGRNGGLTPGNDASASGGGGAGGVGGNGDTPTGGAGGPGIAAPAFAAPLISSAIPAPIQPTWIPAVGPTGLYAGGGGGQGRPDYGGGPGPGGPGGGGKGGPSAANGVKYTGGGGGGSGGGQNAGGDGIVVIRYLA